MLPDVLVTGSSGHLGHALMLALPSYGFTPIGLDILPSTHTTLHGSITDRTFISDIFTAHPSIQTILHTATLHKPHVGSHSKSDFISTNVSGTLNLLELSAKLPALKSFIFTSTTSTFGLSLSPKPGTPAAWIDETTPCRPKNIYGATKVAAEDLCALHHHETKLPILILKTSRFFPELDDSSAARAELDDANRKVCEYAYRRVDVADVVSAHVCAMRHAERIGFARYIVSAPSPFLALDLQSLTLLNSDAGRLVQRVCPEQATVLSGRGWKFPATIDRVYDSSAARRDLDWRPVHTFERAVENVQLGHEWRSELALAVGMRGYHAVPTGVYTT